MENVSFDCEYLLICDSRDVLFQKNVEEFPYDPEIDTYIYIQIYGFIKLLTIFATDKLNYTFISNHVGINISHMFLYPCDGPNQTLG